MAAFAAAAALCAVAVRRQAGEIALVLALTGAAMILGVCIGMLDSLRTLAETLRTAAGLAPETAAPVLKTVGTAVLTRFGAEICRDAKEHGLAAAVETAGAVICLCLAAPLMQAVLDMITELL